MEKKTVLVTGTGGNVGQGILRNLINSRLNLRLIGTNVIDRAAGNHLVDSHYQLPYAFEKGYLPKMIESLDREKVDLIIPSTDYEMSELTKYQDQLPCQLASVGPTASEVYLDKFQTFLFHKKHNIPFAESFLPSRYQNQFSNAILKPRKGRGSRGLVKNFTTTDGYSDEEYMAQELHEGQEITCAVYVSYLTGKIVGLITMIRSLENGATTFCKVFTEVDDQLMEIAQKIVDFTEIKGSFNIQSILDSNKEIHPFEINARISGTNSIRSHFGFKDVQYTVAELLYNEEIEAPLVTKGVAYRYLADVIYPEGCIDGNNRDNFIVF